MNRSGLTHAIQGAAAVFLLGLILLFPQQVVSGVQDGLRSCVNSLIPALYPFLIVCQLVMDCPAALSLGRVFFPYLRLLRIPSPAAGTALLMGLLGGFAPAGRCVAYLRQKNQIDSRQAQALLVACAGSGPGFVVNSVGLLMLGSPEIGWILVECQIIASFLCGLAVACIPKNATGPLPGRTVRLQNAEPSGKPDVTGAIREATLAMLTICGTVVAFRCLYQVLQPILRLDARLCAISAALLEVTSGCLEFAQYPAPVAIYGCCAALSLLSGSVFLQLRALLPDDVSLKPLAATRPLHLAISLGLLRLALHFLPDLAVQAYSVAEPVRIVTTRARPDAALALFALCCLIFFRLQKAAAPRS